MSNGVAGVKVGNVRPMDAGQTTPPQPEQDTFWNRFKAAFVPAFQAQQLGASGGQGSFVLPPATNLTELGPQITGPVGKTKADSPEKGPVQQAPGQTFEDYMAMQAAMMGLGGGGGGGAARPDFSAYRNALIGQTEELNARIQAMYNALGEQAQANLGRIQDVYGGAQTGVGDVYGSATENIAQAFGSAQQQAADQMARLGIEAAAPQVLDPMALSQAQAVSGLETGRAGGLSALERYGATAQDFASQMGQVAQQQGTEFNAALLGALQQRLMDSIAAEQSGGGGGGGGGRSGSLRDQMAFQDWVRANYERDVLGQPSLEEREFAFQVAESAARPLNDWVEESVRRYMEAQFPRGSRIDPEEYWATEAAARQRARQQVGLE